MSKKLNVLVIENNLIEILTMKRTILLLKLNHSIAIANNGEEVLKILEDKSKYPDLILIDLNMPRVSGIEFLTNLKSKKDKKHIPIAILTTSDNMIGLEEC
jgi:CheY-like chemotaxis protein